MRRTHLFVVIIIIIVFLLFLIIIGRVEFGPVDLFVSPPLVVHIPERVGERVGTQLDADNTNGQKCGIASCASTKPENQEKK